MVWGDGEFILVKFFGGGGLGLFDWGVGEFGKIGL